ncbi:hypothetical protein [Salsipaludibacter albus]|uniref:hypothetical protein n=1 Tax=Salsipaludibacter albus TaxID=2849650 RepID=UPI001EE44F5B|nr:hypothetical protein [Salsipaludibacter albus]MBY5161987.1 hypothetical protein [Salsipaludibacter albus]
MRRTWVSVTLTVLAALATLLATVGWWVHATLLDTDRFMALVDPIVTSPATGEAVGDRVTDELFTALDLEERVATSLGEVDAWLRSGIADLLDLDPEGPVAQRLPDGPELAALTPALVAAARERVSDRVTLAVERPRFRSALEQSVRSAHVATVAVLREDQAALPEAVVVDGDVTLDLRPLVETALAPVVRDTADLLGLEPGSIPDDLRLDDLAARLGVEVDPDVATIVLVEEEQLAPWRGAVSTFDRLVWVLVAVAVLLAAAALWTAPRRSRATLWLGLAVAVALAATFPLLAVLSDVLLGRLAGAGARDTLAAVLAAATSDLRWAAGIIIVAALLVAGAALVVGRREEDVPAVA